MNPLAFLAGAGDVAQRRIEREHQNAVQAQVQAHADKLAVAAQFEQLGIDPNFPAEGRMAAFQWRQRILSDPKIKPKDIDAGFADVFARTRRTVSGAAERNAQRSTVPALSALDELLGTNASGDEQPQPLPSGPSADEGMSGAPPTATAPDRRPFDYIAPGLRAAVGAARNQFSMLGPDAEPTSVTGWFTPGEQAQAAADALSKYLAVQKQAGGADGTQLNIAPQVDTKGRISLRTSAKSAGKDVPVSLLVGDKWVPGWADPENRSFTRDDTGETVHPKSWVRRGDQLHWTTYIDGDGKVVTAPKSTTGVLNESSSFEHYVPQTPIKSETESGDLTIAPWNPVQGAVTGPPVVVGRKTLVGLHAQALELSNQGKAVGNELRSAQLLPTQSIDQLISAENAGKDMTKVAPAVYVQMLRRRGQLTSAGDAHGTLPDRYSTAATKEIGKAFRVLDEVDSIRQPLKELVAASGGDANKLPLEHLPAAVLYKMGYGSVDEFNSHIAELSIIALQSASSIGGSSRHWGYIKKTLEHTPNVTKDSTQQILNKLDAIEWVQNAAVAANRDTGLKSGVIKPRTPIPQPGKSAPATDLRKLSTEDLVRMAAGGQ